MSDPGTEPGKRSSKSHAVLEQMADAGKGRFLFGASRMHSDFDDQKGATAVSEAMCGWSRMRV